MPRCGQVVWKGKHKQVRGSEGGRSDRTHVTPEHPAVGGKCKGGRGDHP